MRTGHDRSSPNCQIRLRARAYAGGMTEWGIDTLFNPGKRHMDEEKRRLQSTREEIGDASGGKRIDLEAGVVKIARKDDDAFEDEAVSESEDESAPAAREESAAAARARKRRQG
jgi:hypothetical protein